MTSIESRDYQPAVMLTNSDLNAEAMAPVVKQAIVGLSHDADIDNYVADLEDLAHQINHYSDLRERTDQEEEVKLLALLQRITNNVKNLAVIYTDCIGEAFDQFRQTQCPIKLKINQYPSVIAQLQRQTLKDEQQIRQLTESISILTAAIDRQIAFDTSLKNESQRKAKRATLIASNSDYITTANHLKIVQDHRDELLIKLQLHRSQFSILKLEWREAIARQELAAFDAA
ncbi:MAG TPA: hypothetical protein V6D03_03620 [Candidatus Caenarcaniphilales bacterium]